MVTILISVILFVLIIAGAVVMVMSKSGKTRVIARNVAAATRCVARAAERNNWTAEDFAEILHTLGLTAPTRHEEPR